MVAGLITNAQDAGKMFSLSLGNETRWIHLTADIAFWSAATFAMINMVLMTRRGGLVRSLKSLTVLLCLCTGGILVATVISEFPPKAHGDVLDNKWLDRSTTASIFLLTGSTICLVLARAILRLKSKFTPHEGVSQLELKCPNCGTQQAIGLNGSCRHCLLRFTIQLTDPRCPGCDHLLLNLESSRCPECGHEIRRPTSPIHEPPTSPNSVPTAG